MAAYRRKRDSDTWHWCRNCSKYPTGADVETSNSRPSSGELCNECKDKESKQNCQG